MQVDVHALLALTRELQEASRLEDMLERLVVRVAALLDVERASIRLLDETRTRLLVGARAGEPVHDPVSAPGGLEFTLGEGLVGWIAQQAVPIRTGEASADPRFAPRAGMSSGFCSFVGVPLMDGALCIGVLSAVHPLPNYFDDDEEALLSLVAGMSAPYLQIARLRRLAEVDPLTGALNRRGLDEHWPDDATDAPLSLAVVDVDEFKRINDTFGHDVGDEAIRAIAHVLGNLVRRGDGVVRLGGDEFLLVLPGTTAADAQAVAERARHAIEMHAFVSDGERIGVTISVGVAERLSGEARADLMRRADAAMYRAKTEGRNRVRVALDI
jgi:diguanylate cyclase (GGDEF)-like protein